MGRLLGIIIILLSFQAVNAQKRIEVNYLTDNEVISDVKFKFEIKTEFTVTENGYVSRIRLLNFDSESGNYIIKFSANSGIQKSLVAGPYVWKIGETAEGRMEFELPHAIPVLKDIIYSLSVSQNSPGKKSQKFSNSAGRFSDIGNPKIPAKKQPANNLLRDNHFNYTVLVVAYAKLNAGKIGQAQIINFNSQPSPLNQYLQPSGGIGIYGYQWQFSPDNISWTDIKGANETSYSPPALTVNTWYRLNVTSGNFTKESSNPILIKVHPQLVACTIGNGQAICYNKIPAALSQVSPPSGGTGSYTYQWQNSPDNRNWSDIAGANHSSYSPPSLTTNTWYRLNIISGYSVTSNVILIEVDPELIPGSIGSDQSICYNSVPSAFVQLTSAGGGTGVYNYQWQISTNNISWTNISGANSVTYSPNALTANSWFRRNINSGTCESKTSNSVQISIFPSLTSGTIGTAQSICYGTTPAILSQVTSPSGGAGNYSYQWQRSPDNNLWTDITGANLASYSPPVLTTTTWFRRNVLSGSCVTESSNSVQIIVHPILVSGTIGDNQSICYNATPSSFSQLTPSTGATGSYTYQWQTSNDNINWTNIQGASSLVYSPPALTARTWYRRNVASSTCGTETSNPVLINVFPSLNPGTIEADQTICYNTVPAILRQVSAPSGGTGVFTFQWQTSNDNINWTNVQGASSLVYSPPALTARTWYRRNVTSGCTESSNSVRISLYLPVNSAQLRDSKTIYENNSTTFNLVISGGTAPYNINYTINGIAQPTITNYISGTEISTGILSIGTYRYQLTSVTDAAGCNCLSLGTSITITVLREQVSSTTNKALIVVNSAASSYSDYRTYIKPYLDNFGIPYDICNVNSTSLPPLNNYAVIIFGHKNVYQSGYPIIQIEAAVSAGAGLYSFDPHLFDYSSRFNNLITQRSVSSSRISILNLGHFITELHTPDTYSPGNNLVNLLASWTVVQNSTLAGGIDLASMSSGGQTVALLQAADYGSGRIVKWCGYDWMYENILGPVYGMDDLIWRGIVWAARKPFVMQGLPPMLTMRVDDVDGTGTDNENNFAWVRICNEFGIIPWLGLFTQNIPTGYLSTLKSLIDAGQATASPHAKGYATTYSGFIYYNHDNLSGFDPAAETRSARDFFIRNGLEMSNFVVPHYYEYSSSSLSAIRAMGVEFLGIHWLPDNSYNPSPAWINCAPYRINRNGTSSTTEARPVYYAGYVNFNGIEFFNCLAEIRDDGGYEWFPSNSITTTAARGVRHLRRSYNSMVLASLFTHEQTYIASITQSNWREILRQITLASAEYDPEYVSLDYAVKYIRAKSNIKLTDVQDNIGSVVITYNGNNDMNTKCYLFTEQNGETIFRLVTLPQVNGSNTVQVPK